MTLTDRSDSKSSESPANYNLTLPDNAVPDPISATISTADEARAFRGSVKFIASGFILPDVEPTEATNFFHRGWVWYDKQKITTRSPDNGAVKACKGKSCTFQVTETMYGWYALTLEHVNPAYYFTYSNILSMYDWLAQLPHHVERGDPMKFGSFKLDVVFRFVAQQAH